MTARILDADERLPLYQRLADALRHQVVAGHWRPGDRLPSENELAEQYTLAAGTVRQALSQLVSEGILERQHGRGTFVRRPSFDQSLFRFYRFRTASGETSIPESRILTMRREKTPEYVASQLAVATGSDAINIQRLRLVNDEPVLAEEIWLPADRFARLLELDRDQIGPLLYPVYDSVCGLTVAHAEETLTAELANKVVARLLRLEQPAPVIVIERIARAFDGSPLEWRRSRGNAKHFHYQTEIR